jgi:50S ribosomal subunit-associated GTPase HflX
LNKIDLIPPQEIAHLSDDHEAIPVSSLQYTNLEQLLIAIDAALVIDPLVEFRFRFPQSEGSILASLGRATRLMLRSWHVMPGLIRTSSGRSRTAPSSSKRRLPWFVRELCWCDCVPLR